MTDPHDIDAWLHGEVEPLPPPPGTFERIRKRARRRKARRAVLSAASAGAAAALTVLAVVALPRVVPSVLHLKSHPAGDNSAAGTVGSGPARAASPAATSPAATSPSSTPDGTTSYPVPGGLPPVPGNFQATSVTFISSSTGWVIGQAGTPGRCYNGNICTSMARTDDAGKTWSGAVAPGTGAPDGDTGVSQIRFLNFNDGWAFGPALWATHDGGQIWTQIPLGGRRVLSLETVGHAAFAVVARCAGIGPGFAAGCIRFWLYSSPASSDSWRPVPGVADVSATRGSAGPGPAGGGSAALVLTQAQGYWYRPDGTLFSGPVTGTAPWTAVGSSPLPCGPGAAQADGRPSGGQLAASTAGDLTLACPGSGQSGAGQQEITYASSDGGQTWQRQGSLTIDGTATSLAAGTGGVMTLATTHCIDVSADGGATWRTALQGPAGGFSYVGLTSSTQAVAVPADPGQRAVWLSYDGGQSWSRRAIKGGG